MKKIIAAALLALSMSMSACAGLKNADGTINVTEVTRQMAGVAAALSNLPPVPGDSHTAQQIAGYAAWAAWGANILAGVAGATR